MFEFGLTVEKKKYKEWAINIEKEIDRNQDTKISKVETTTFNAIKIVANSLSISDKDLGEFVRDMLKA